MYFNAEEFGKRMQKVRCENHLTQEQLADLLNISRIHVARIERGARTCSIDLLVETQMRCMFQPIFANGESDKQGSKAAAFKIYF